MKGFGGRLLTVLLWVCILAAVPLVGVRWLDSSATSVAVVRLRGRTPEGRLCSS